MRPDHRPRQSRKGFTLIECLVSVTVIGILIALLIPAVQMGREAARKVQCQSNLRQIGLGILNYESSFQCLPPAMGSRGHSFHVAVLPFMEQRPLFDAINFQFQPTDWAAENQSVSGVAMSFFLCPSDTHGGQGEDFGWTNYAGSRGVGVQKYGENGAFRLPSVRAVKLSSVTDGTSSTAMAAEWVLGNGPDGDRDSKRAIFHTPSRLTKPEEFGLFTEACHNINTLKAKVSAHRKGLNWMHGEFGATLYNHTLAPNDHTCINGTGYQTGAWTAGSRHPGGASVLFCDGSVRFISQSIQPGMWRALGSRDGGETVSSDSY